MGVIVAFYDNKRKAPSIKDVRRDGEGCMVKCGHLRTGGGRG